MPFIHIRSSKFPIAPGESEELINDGMYGKAFAAYLASHLRERGYDIPFTCCEDWGWWIEVRGQPFVLGCCVYGASDAADRPDLCAQVSRNAERRWSWSKFRVVDTTARVKLLFGDLKAILSADPEITIIGYPEAFPL